MFGVPVRLHFTFIIFLIFLVVVGAEGGQSGTMYAFYVVSLFASVLLHELGHVAVGKRYGIKTIEIVMFPIGGIARLERQPRPREELWIALAGPFVNLAIAAGLFLYLFQTGAIKGPDALMTPNDDNLIERIAIGNLILAVFNLLPAFPMDGGRVLRSLLARFQPEDHATRTAALAGRLLAVAMGLFGLLNSNVMLVFIAFFVYLGAAQESAVAVGRALSHGIPVRAAMITDYRTLSHGDSLRDAANMLLSTSQSDFPVILGEQVVGLLSRNSLMRGMARDGLEAYVAGNMERNFVTLAPDMDLAEAMPLLGTAGSCALVMEGGKLLGLLTRENFAEFLMLRRLGMDTRPESGALL